MLPEGISETIKQKRLFGYTHSKFKNN